MRLGVLDIGSNTVHLLLVDAHPGARPVPFASHKRPLSLVQYLEPDGSINDAGQQIIQRQLQVTPTLTIRPGFPVRIIVTRDLIFEPDRG